MTDYIKREDAYRRLTEYYHHTREIQHESLRIALIGIPSADVEPVVRCKDCRHRIKWNDSFGCAFWGYYGDEFADGEMFCRKGERKDDD